MLGGSQNRNCGDWGDGIGKLMGAYIYVRQIFICILTLFQEIIRTFVGMQDNALILLKDIDKSVLYDGFGFPPEVHELVYAAIGHPLKHGQSTMIRIVVGTEEYECKLTNINFSQKKYPDHPDLLQVRYSKNAPFALKMRAIFSPTLAFVTEQQQVLPKGKHIIIPKEMREKFALYATAQPGLLCLDVITRADSLAVIDNKVTEEDFESKPAEWVDPTAKIETRERFVKMRKLDRGVCENLKRYYDYRCQITGEHIGEAYGGSVVEAHHIDYFVNSQNNDSSNIIILSPNFHRIIHRYNPKFNRKKLQFEFANGVLERLRLNRHL